MNEAGSDTGGLNFVGLQTVPGASGVGDGREIAVRSARKDGRQVVTLRCLEAGAESVVECEVYPVSGLRVEPLRPGPYRFPSTDEAQRFMEEAVQSLTYLGCDVA